MAITPGNRHSWPSGIYTVIARLTVDDEWASTAFGQPLLAGTEPGMGPWIGAGGILPSGEMVEVVKYALYPGDPHFQLRMDENASRERVLGEFVRETGISESLIE